VTSEQQQQQQQQLQQRYISTHFAPLGPQKQQHCSFRRVRAQAAIEKHPPLLAHHTLLAQHILADVSLPVTHSELASSVV
jgi:hypothetical protein